MGKLSILSQGILSILLFDSGLTVDSVAAVSCKKSGKEFGKRGCICLYYKKKLRA